MKEVKTLTPQEKKEQFIQSFVDRIESQLGGAYLTTTFEERIKAILDELKAN
jgi:uncharacterized protein (DUF1015 family)